MAGMQNVLSAIRKKLMVGWGLESDDGTVDLSGKDLLSVEATVTLAELNAGKTLVPDAAGRQLKPVDFFVQFNGAFTTATDIRLSDTNSTPVEIVTITIAQAGNGVLHTRDAGTHTLGAGFLGNLTAGKGIQIRKTGSSAAGGTDIKVQVTYRIVA